MSEIFSLQTKIKSMFGFYQTRKSAGPDGMHSEFLINWGPNTKRLLSKLYTDIQQSGTAASWI